MSDGVEIGGAVGGGTGAGVAPPPPPPGGTTTTTTSTSSGGSTSGGTGSALASLMKSYIIALQNMGFPPGSMTAFAQHAASQGWSSQEFLYYLRQTPEYMDRFPGIFNQDGTLRMTESQYMSYEQQYRNIAGQYGIPLSQEQIGMMIGQGQAPKPPQIFQMQAQACQRMTEYAPALRQFEQTLKARGLIQNNLSKAQIRDFLIGEGPTQWYRVYEEFSARTAAVNAGFKIAGSDQFGTEGISRGQILSIIHRLPGVQSETDLASVFQKLATDFRTMIPQAQSANFNVTEKDLIKLETGGKGSQRAAAKVQQALTNYAAMQGTRAQTPLVATQTGTTILGGGLQRQAQGE